MHAEKQAAAAAQAQALANKGSQEEVGNKSGTESMTQTTNAKPETPSKKNGGKLEEAYERKPSPINLKPITKENESLEEAKTKVLNRSQRALSPKNASRTSNTARISSRQVVDDMAKKNNSHRNEESHGESKDIKKGSARNTENADLKKERQFSPDPSVEALNQAKNRGKTPRANVQQSGEDEVAAEESKMRRTRRASAKMKKDESSDLEVTAIGGQKKKDSSVLKGAKNADLKPDENTHDRSGLYHKVNQRKEILQRTMVSNQYRKTVAPSEQSNAALSPVNQNPKTQSFS